jgi:hypothetical protein
LLDQAATATGAPVRTGVAVTATPTASTRETAPDTQRGRPRAMQQRPKAHRSCWRWAAHDAIEDGGGYFGTVELQDPVAPIATDEL